MEDQTLHHFVSDVAPIIIGVVFIIAAAWVISVIVLALKQRASLRTQADFYNRLLDKFGSASEFVDYLQSETGRQFFEELTVKTASPMSKILGSIQKGVITVLIGLGMVVLANLFDKSLGGDLFIVLAVGGTIGLMVGTGFLISSFITYRPSKSWGLLPGAAKLKETNAETAAK